MDNDLTLKAGALKLGFVIEDEFDPVVRSRQDGQALRRHQRVARESREASKPMGNSGANQGHAPSPDERPFSAQPEE